MRKIIDFPRVFVHFWLMASCRFRAPSWGRFKLSWPHLGPVLGRQGHVWDRPKPVQGPSRVRLGVHFGPFRNSSGRFGAVWGCLGADLAPTRRQFCLRWHRLGASSVLVGSVLEPKMAILCPLGASWGRAVRASGAVFVVFWAVVWAFWFVFGTSWAVLGPSWAAWGPSWGTPRRSRDAPGVHFVP